MKHKKRTPGGSPDTSAGSPVRKPSDSDGERTIESGPDTIGLDEAIARLEALVDELESGKLPLETALERFEEAVALGARCRAFLKQAEARVRRIVDTADGTEQKSEPMDLEN